MGPLGVNFFRVSGDLTHKISSVKPNGSKDPGFAQIFVVGDHGTGEAQLRINQALGQSQGMERRATMNVDVVHKLMKLLYQINPHASTDTLW
jgi:hypothetical protein